MTQETNDSRSEVLSQEPSASDRQKLERKIVVQLEYLKTKLMEVLTALDGITAKDKQEETISRIPSGRRSAAGVFMRTKATLQSLEALGGFIKKLLPPEIKIEGINPEVMEGQLNIRQLVAKVYLNMEEIIDTTSVLLSDKNRPAVIAAFVTASSPVEVIEHILPTEEKLKIFESLAAPKQESKEASIGKRTRKLSEIKKRLSAEEQAADDALFIPGRKYKLTFKPADKLEAAKVSGVIGEQVQIIDQNNLRIQEEFERRNMSGLLKVPDDHVLVHIDGPRLHVLQIPKSVIRACKDARASSKNSESGTFQGTPSLLK